MLEKLQQFLEEEQELLQDLQSDLNDFDTCNREYSQTYGLWASQLIRVRALQDAVDLLR